MGSSGFNKAGTATRGLEPCRKKPKTAKQVRILPDPFALEVIAVERSEYPGSVGSNPTQGCFVATRKRPTYAAVIQRPTACKACGDMNAVLSTN